MVLIGYNMTIPNQLSLFFLLIGTILSNLNFQITASSNLEFSNSDSEYPSPYFNDDSIKTEKLILKRDTSEVRSHGGFDDISKYDTENEHGGEEGVKRFIRYAESKPKVNKFLELKQPNNKVRLWIDLPEDDVLPPPLEVLRIPLNDVKPKLLVQRTHPKLSNYSSDFDSNSFQPIENRELITHVSYPLKIREFGDNSTLPKSAKNFQRIPKIWEILKVPEVHEPYPTSLFPEEVVELKPREFPLVSESMDSDSVPKRLSSSKVNKFLDSGGFKYPLKIDESWEKPQQIIKNIQNFKSGLLAAENNPFTTDFLVINKEVYKVAGNGMSKVNPYNYDTFIEQEPKVKNYNVYTGSTNQKIKNDADSVHESSITSKIFKNFDNFESGRIQPLLARPFSIGGSSTTAGAEQYKNLDYESRNMKNTNHFKQSEEIKTDLPTKFQNFGFTNFKIEDTGKSSPVAFSFTRNSEDAFPSDASLMEAYMNSIRSKYTSNKATSSSLTPKFYQPNPKDLDLMDYVQPATTPSASLSSRKRKFKRNDLGLDLSDPGEVKRGQVGVFKENLGEKEPRKRICGINTLNGRQSCRFSCNEHGESIPCIGVYCFCVKDNQPIKISSGLCGPNTQFGWMTCRSICNRPSDIITCTEINCFCNNDQPVDKGDPRIDGIGRIIFNKLGQYFYCGSANGKNNCRKICKNWGHVTCGEVACYCDRGRN